MRILYLTEFLTSLGGGGAASFSRNALAMAARGHRVHIICHKSGTDTLALPDSQGLLIHRINPEVSLAHGSFPAMSDQISYVIGMIRQGRRIISNERIDIIHANTLNPSIAGAILGSAYDIPVVNTIHHIHGVQAKRHLLHKSPENKNQIVASLENLTRSVYEKIIVSLPAARIHSVSNTTSKDLRRIGYKGKIELIPNGIELEEFDKVAHHKEYRPFLLFIGRLVDYKNLGVVIDSFAPVARRFPNARLVIVGDGPMRGFWQEKARRMHIDAKVEFRGYVSDNEKIGLLTKCSGLVFPSLVEGFGLVILEAFAMSKPVLVSDIDSLRELVQDGVNGFVIDPYSVNGWTSKICTIIMNPSVSRAMGAKGRRQVEDYRIDKLANMLESVYRDLHSSNVKTVEKTQIAE